jgi:hypothetical protein
VRCVAVLGLMSNSKVECSHTNTVAFCATTTTHYCYSITLVLPQGAHVGDLLQALRERLQLQVLEAGGASPLQLRLLQLDLSRFSKLLQPAAGLRYSCDGGGVYDRDALLDKSLYYRREGKHKIVLEAIPQVQRATY